MEDRETARMRKYGESKKTRIMMDNVPRVTSGLGLRKFQANGLLLTLVYNVFITYYLLPIYSLPTCFYLCCDHHQVTCKNVWNLNNLSKCMN